MFRLPPFDDLAGDEGSGKALTADEPYEDAKSNHDVLGPISYFALDGNSVRRRAFVQPVSRGTFANVPWAGMLKQCKFMNQFFGEGSTINRFGWKQLVKM